MDAVEDNRMSPKRLFFANPLQALQSQRPASIHNKILNMNSSCSGHIG